MTSPRPAGRDVAVISRAGRAGWGEQGARARLGVAERLSRVREADGRGIGVHAFGILDCDVVRGESARRVYAAANVPPNRIWSAFCLCAERRVARATLRTHSPNIHSAGEISPRRIRGGAGRGRRTVRKLEHHGRKLVCAVRVGGRLRTQREPFRVTPVQPNTAPMQSNMSPRSDP